MLKLRIAPEATFPAKVAIPVPGGDPAQIQIQCRYMDKPTLDQKVKDLTDDEFAAEVVVGWSGVDEEFSAEALAYMLKAYVGSAREIVTAYLRELTGARPGN